MKRNLIALAAIFGAALLLGMPVESGAKNDKTRGIGVYPGDPAEYFGPKVIAGGKDYRNIALFRAASHSSSIDPEHTAQLATDGVVKSDKGLVCSWKSAGAKDEWITVDLGSVSTLEKMHLEWLNAPVSAVLQVSNDGKSWNDVLAFGAEKEVTLPKTKARYVRLALSGTADGAPFELAEWQVYGQGGVKTIPAAAPKRHGNRQYLAGGNWKLCRSTEVAASGEELSVLGYDDAQWMTATVPGTVLGSYLNVGAVLDPNYEANQNFISDQYFNNDFWYRNTFKAHIDTPRQLLHFTGINFKAEVYLNGKKIAFLVGAFRETDIDVTGILKEGENALAVKIIRNDNYGTIKEQDAFYPGPNGGVLGADNPTMHATIGWDWFPTVRGRNMGIYDDVYVRYTGDVCVEDPFVRTELPLPDTTSATIKAQATLVNRSDKAVTGILAGNYGELTFEKTVTIQPGEEKVVALDDIRLENPKLWWPKGYGQPNLYEVNISFVADGKISDACSFKSGVRQMTYDLYPYNPVTGCAMRGRNNNQRLDVYINGRRFTGFGGNWGFPEHLLNYRQREYDIAVGFHADQNFNMIRNWVGMTGNRAFYEACDRHGVMIWQDFWLANPADGPDPADPQRFKETAKEYVRLIRNHPSVAFYCGRNEGYPPEELDNYLGEMVLQEHTGHFYFSHSGADGVSGGGGYGYCNIWDFFKLFGGDKIHSERGIPSIMNYENLLRTMGEEYVNPVSTAAHPNLMWGLHDYSLGEKPGKWVAQTTERFNRAMAGGFGEPADAEEFTKLAQWYCYDQYRAVFEGRAEHRYGLLLWMSHSAWPSLVWQTYDYYFEPLAAYFGAKKACEPLHVLYNPVIKKVVAVNYCDGNHKGLKVVARILDINGNEVWTNSCNLDINEDETKVCFDMPVPDGITDVYFQRLYIYSADGKVLSENLYWQGKRYNNLKALRNVPKADVEMKVSGKKGEYTVTVTNESETPAMMLRVKVQDSKTGDLILPVWYSDNYFFLMGGESRKIKVRVRAEDCKGKPVFECEGFNI